MSTTISDYLGQMGEGFTEGLGDLSRSAIADIGDSYQEVLLQDASVTPADPLPATYETVTTTIEPDVGGVELEPYGPEPNDGIPGLDMG
jgi:hypothetical protein